MALATAPLPMNNLPVRHTSDHVVNKSMAYAIYTRKNDLVLSLWKLLFFILLAADQVDP